MYKITKQISGTFRAALRVPASRVSMLLLAGLLTVSFAAQSYALSIPYLAALVGGLTKKQAQEVHDLLREGEYDDALDMLKDASDRDPFNDDLKESIAAVYRKMGWELYGDGELEDGFDAFRRASTYEPEKDSDTYLGLGYGSFKMKNYDDAMYYLYDAVYIDDEDPDAHIMLAQIYYLRGRTEEAIEEWNIVLQLDPGNKIAKEALKKAEREYKVEGDFHKNETYYFTIKYEGEENRDLGYEVLDILDRAYGDVGGDMSYYPNEPVTVVLYTEQQFSDVTEAPSWSGGLFDGSIRIPVGGELDMDKLEIVLYHEYAHYVTLMMAGNKLPTWLSEGIAQYEERWVHGGYRYEYSGPAVDLRQLAGPFSTISSGEAAQVAYMLSLSAVEFYVDAFGTYRLSHLVTLIGEDEDIDEAFLGAAGVGFDDFQEMWQESLQ